MWEALFVVVVVSFFFGALVYWGLRARRTFVKDKTELINLLESFYKEVSGDVKVVAGEANKVVYEKICKLMDKAIKEGKISQLEIVIGPQVSVFPDDLKLLNEDGTIKQEVVSPHKIHPLFELLKKYPDVVKVYYKTDASFLNVRHFAIVENGKRFLYVEKLHSPLQESEALLVENPNPILFRKYKKLFEKVVRDKSVVPLTVNNLNLVKFSDFREFTEKRAA